jgi:ATPase subunit of ABC transporter with duplicated ATPase domains
LKQGVNSYSARLSANVRSYSFDRTRTLRRAPRFPNYGWLAMIILTVAALAYSVYTRAREQEREARNSYNETSAQVENVKSANKRIKDQTISIRQNPAAAAQAAQNQSRMLRRNEVVVAPR